MDYIQNSITRQEDKDSSKTIHTITTEVVSAFTGADEATTDVNTGLATIIRS